jgi:hypothetical protein
VAHEPNLDRPILALYPRLPCTFGPSLILGAFLSILRQAGFVGVDTEVPVLTISVGVLWTMANLLLLPKPSWIISE